MRNKLTVLVLSILLVAVVSAAIIGIIYLAQGYVLGPCETLTDAKLTGWHNWNGKRVHCVLGSPIEFRKER